MDGEIIIYNYDSYTLEYIGLEKEKIIRGVGLPAHSTSIMPPLHILQNRNEETIIYNLVENKWDIVSKNTLPKKAEEIYKHYNSQHKDYTPITLTDTNFSVYNSIPNNLKMNSSYREFAQYFNQVFMIREITTKFSLIQKKFDELNSVFEERISIGEQITTLNEKNNKSVLDNISLSQLLMRQKELIEYHPLLSEEFIHCMKTVIDRLIQLTAMLVNLEECINKKKLTPDSIGALKGLKKGEDVLNIINGNDESYAQDDTSFIDTINDIDNSFKHSAINPEAGLTSVSIDKPAIKSYYLKYNKYGAKIFFYDHYAEQLMIGFQNTILRIIENQKTYIELHKND